MERRTVRGERSVVPYRHQVQVVKSAHRIYCPCGRLLYEGPRPDFSMVSCPRCKRKFDVQKEPPNPAGK